MSRKIVWISNIKVKKGIIVLGFLVKANANTISQIDDISLMKLDL